MRAVFLLTLLVLALASRALAGGAGGEYAVDVHDGEPFDDDATPNARASEYAAADEDTNEEETHVEGDVMIDSPASSTSEEAEVQETPRASTAPAEEEADGEADVETHGSAMDDPPASTTTMEVHEEDVQLDHGDVASASQRRAAETEALEAEALAAAWADDAQTPQSQSPNRRTRNGCDAGSPRRTHDGERRIRSGHVSAKRTPTWTRSTPNSPSSAPGTTTRRPPPSAKAWRPGSPRPRRSSSSWRGGARTCEPSYDVVNAVAGGAFRVEFGRGFIAKDLYLEHSCMA